jgi:streptogramin lyase
MFVLDQKGTVWYSSFGEQKIGKMDPVTGEVREYEVGISKPIIRQVCLRFVMIAKVNYG